MNNNKKMRLRRRTSPPFLLALLLCLLRLGNLIKDGPLGADPSTDSPGTLLIVIAPKVEAVLR